jgi:hypothetical protein
VLRPYYKLIHYLPNVQKLKHLKTFFTSVTVPSASILHYIIEWAQVLSLLIQSAIPMLFQHPPELNMRGLPASPEQIPYSLSKLFWLLVSWTSGDYRITRTDTLQIVKIILVIGELNMRGLPASPEQIPCSLSKLFSYWWVNMRGLPASPEQIPCSLSKLFSYWWVKYEGTFSIRLC